MAEFWACSVEFAPISAACGPKSVKVAANYVESRPELGTESGQVCKVTKGEVPTNRGPDSAESGTISIGVGPDFGMDVGPK